MASRGVPPVLVSAEPGAKAGLDREVVRLIRRMPQANVTWGGPRIRNELAKLSIDVAVSTVAKYMPRRRRAPSPTWRAFLENHMKDLVVPTASFGVLFGLVVLNGTRCHLSLDGDAPESRGVQRPELGEVLELPRGGRPRPH